MRILTVLVRSLVDALVARFHDLDTQHDSNVTPVFDKGNNCEDIIAAVYDSYGEQYTMVVAKNKNLERTLTATLLREIAKRRQKLENFQWQLRRWQKGIITKGRRPTLAGMQRKVDECLKARHMKELFEVSVEPGTEDIPKLKCRFNRSAWRRLQRTLLGKNLIFTDRTEWTDAQIVHGYRAQHHVECAFRDMKDVRHIAVRHGQTISSHQMFDKLAGIKEVGVVFIRLHENRVRQRYR